MFDKVSSSAMENSNIQIKNISGSHIEITAEIPAEDFERAYKHVFDSYSKEANIPGFRPGHVPEHVLREKISEATLLQKAAEETIQRWYERLLSEKKIEAIGQPHVSITKLARNNPLGIVLTTAILPDIELPDYKAIAKDIFDKKDEIIVEEKEIDDALEYLRKSRQRRGSPETEEVTNQNSKDNDVQLDDEFAKSVGNFQTQVELREAIRTNMTFEKEMKKKEEKRMAALDAIAKETKIEIPDVMIAREKEKMLNELKGSVEHMGMKWNDYLSHVKKTEEEILNGWNDDAKKRVTFGLLLRAIAEKEGITVSDEEVHDYVEKIKKQYPPERQKEIKQERMEQYAYGVLKNEKVFQALELPPEK